MMNGPVFYIAAGGLNLFLCGLRCAGYTCCDQLTNTLPIPVPEQKLLRDFVW
jgi:hypothetical protein